MAERIPPEIEREPFDAIIIGAGINGAGIARDAALRGLKVLLLDKGDLSSGTTAWSTRLIHGGLRYLEHGEFALVRESLRERERLFRNATHLVKPLPLLIPIYESARRGPFMIRAGMLAYDLLSFDKTLARHQILSPDEALKHAPGLKREDLRGAALYFDAQVEYAERLALENTLDAQAHGALIITYARVEGFILEGKAVRGVEFADALAGHRYTARAQVVVNVSGPWVDEMLGHLDAPVPRLIGGTKGSHIIVKPFTGAPREALYVEASADGRPFFIIPWNKLYLIGTTDLRYEGELDRVRADAAEIDYLLAETNRVIPSAQLTRARVAYTYSGIRPLAYCEERAERGITRRHFIHDHAPAIEGLLSIVGGKLTTYRNLAEGAVNLIYRKLNRAPAPCLTADAPLPGALGPRGEDFKSFCDRFTKESTLSANVNERLLRVYGTRARDVLELAAAEPELAQPFCAETTAIGAEVLFSFQQELAQTLSDCLLRRTMVGLSATLGVGADLAAAQLARKYLGWSEARAEREVAAYRAYIERFQPRTITA